MEQRARQGGARTRARRGRVLAMLVVLAGLAGACGSRLPDEVLEELDAERAGSTSSQTQTESPDDGEMLRGDVALDGATTDGGSSGGTSGGSSTGGGGTSGGTGSAAAACRGGATAPGVTATEIKVATMVTASGPLPGATEGAFRGAQAYMAKVNAEGGVCGRRITVVKGDDGLDPQRARGEFLRLEPQVFAFVGSLAVADSGYADLIGSTKVPYVGTLVDPAGRGPTVYPRVPENITHTAPFQYYRDTYPDVRNVAFLYADVGGVRANAPTSREGLKAVGFNMVYDSGAQSVSPDFTPEVIAMRNANAQMVYLFAFEVNMHVRIARNMRQQNFEPPLKVANIGYNSKLVDLLGPIANGWTNHIDHLPVLNEAEPAQSPSLREFLTWNNRVAPGAQIDLFPVNAWSSSALFVEALRSAGGDLTRERVLAGLEAITRTDGGGIRAPTNPRTGATEGCFIIARVDNGAWVREHPSEGYDCSLGVPHRFG